MRPEFNPAQPVTFRPIGTIITPFPEAEGTPIQGVYAQGSEGRVILDEAFAPALDDIEGFERLWLVYWMDRVGSYKSKVVPYRDTIEHGLFATRSPSRPNPIGLSVVRFLRREGSVLHVADVDMLNNTPLLDIKPYVSEFDSHPQSRAGWYENAGVDRRHADGRFHDSRRAESTDKQAIAVFKEL
jgi:tRNA-Thr(GGU) m(6)t(6)A37 methyltransferase TsaA